MRIPRTARIALLLVATLALFPATTRKGMNYRVTEHRIPLGLKGLQFILRDLHYRQYARQITRGLSNEEKRVEALCDWTRERIRPTPAGRPVLDDHIDQIIRRGYGEEDQRADVFTTLATYAGSPGFWRVLRTQDREVERVLSFVRIGGQWTVWDVGQGKVYKEGERWVTPAELGFDEMGNLHPLRAEKQMVGPRILFEVRRLRNRAMRWFARPA